MERVRIKTARKTRTITGLAKNRLVAIVLVIIGSIITILNNDATALLLLGIIIISLLGSKKNMID